jgi:hypothetical protein
MKACSWGISAGALVATSDMTSRLLHERQIDIACSTSRSRDIFFANLTRPTLDENQKANAMSDCALRASAVGWADALPARTGWAKAESNRG